LGPTGKCPVCEKPHAAFRDAHDSGEAGVVRVVVDEHEPATGRTSVRTGSTRGHTTGEHDPESGSIKLHLSGDLDVGRPNETRVCHSLEQALERNGITIIEVQPGLDHYGIDRVFKTPHGDINVQVVTAISDTETWRELRKSGEVSLEVTIEEAATLLHETMATKAQAIGRREREDITLVLDADQTGVLSKPRILKAYCNFFQDPVKEFGFRNVWVVGPTADDAIRLDC
jgi:hypothetical protein